MSSDDRADYCLDCSSPPVEVPGTRFYTRMQWGGAYGQTVVRARPNEHSQRTESPSDAQLFPCLGENPVGACEVRTRIVWDQGQALCHYTSLARRNSCYIDLSICQQGSGKAETRWGGGLFNNYSANVYVYEEFLKHSINSISSKAPVAHTHICSIEALCSTEQCSLHRPIHYVA